MPSYSVIDRETNELCDTGLTEVEVVEQHTRLGQRSSALALVRALRPERRITIEDVIVKRVRH